MKRRLNVKESSSGKDQVRMTYMKESGDEMKKKAVKWFNSCLATEDTNGRNN